MPPKSIIQGFDYQSKLFWIEAARLLVKSNVEQVGFEVDKFKSFDDVAAVYSVPNVGERGEKITEDYYQIKFHVDHAGALTWKGLMDPAFIGATSNSLLVKLKDAVEASEDSSKIRLHLVSPWPIEPTDELAKLVSNNGGEIRLNILMNGGPKSAMGKIREEFRKHLKINSDDQLVKILSPFRVVVSSNMRQIRENMNLSLSKANLIEADFSKTTCIYDDLIKKEYQAGSHWFDANRLKEVCEREELFETQTSQSPEKYTIGVRSFYRLAEHLEDECDQFLCLLNYFDQRLIKDPEFWNGEVYEEIKKFCGSTPTDKSEILLKPGTHLSISILLGYFLDMKFPAQIDILQTGNLWSMNDSWDSGEDDLKIENQDSDGEDLAVAVSITHDISNEVVRCMSSEGHTLRYLKNFVPKNGPSQKAVSNGGHAFSLAQKIVEEIKRDKTLMNREGKISIFIAAPVAVAFYLGRQIKAIGPVQIFEYDFTAQSGANQYFPSISLPRG